MPHVHFGSAIRIFLVLYRTWLIKTSNFLKAILAIRRYASEALGSIDLFVSDEDIVLLEQGSMTGFCGSGLDLMQNTIK